MREKDIRKLISIMVQLGNIVTLNDVKDTCYDIIRANNRYDESFKFSNSLPKQRKFEQRVRNVVCHNRFPEGVGYNNATCSFYKLYK